jgi:hypothetical protein
MSELCIHGGATRCWPCQTMGCYDEPTLHVWWDQDDVKHAAATGQSAPTGWCGCAFCGEPAVARAEGAKQ